MRVAREMAEQCLALRTRTLQRRLNAIYDEHLRPLGLRVGQLNLLVGIGAHGPMRSAELAAHLHMDPSTLSRDLARMQKQGWLAGSGRLGRLELSQDGRSILERAYGPWEKAQREAAALLREVG